MKRTVDTQSVFLASPNEMMPYREIVAKVVDNLDRNLLSQDERELKILTAMKDVPASITGMDPQFVINEGIADSFHFIIVILGARVGTETPRDIAGTIEEFRRAEARNKRTGGTPVIMVYFCQDEVKPFDIDAQQLLLVQKFKDSIQNKGLWKYFAGADNFEQMVETDLRGHLNARKVTRKVTSKDINLDTLP